MQHLTSRLLVATLLGTLLACTIVFADEVVERCLCSQTTQGINIKNMKNVELHEPTDFCPKVEVIATLKTGEEVCLNTEAPMVKKIIEKLRQRNAKPSLS
ncbi:chemokine vCXCL6 [Cercopithecine betaherpesvirus 5]|uniref:Chemokine vCXCL6 n=1 Tax=Simian cytomegalovirus (strain Colburn) TaxID=50292 RepID=G8XU21_SCMVC|nr:chemokine vCXCL6 [Cercopithecine betaherpesvirus 5]